MIRHEQETRERLHSAALYFRKTKFSALVTFGLLRVRYMYVDYAKGQLGKKIQPLEYHFGRRSMGPKNAENNAEPKM